MADMTRLSVNIASFSYPDGTCALSGINFEVRAGDFAGILGANGSGKTTLLRAMDGLIKDFRGTILLDGADIRKLKPREIYKKVGLVFQNPNDQLFAPTVFEDVAFGPLNMGFSRDEVQRRVAQALVSVDMDEYAGKAIQTLSFGQKKRVCMAGLLAMGHEILLLDEPTAGLDPAGEYQMLELLAGLNRSKGITIVMATHSVDVVPLFIRRLHILNCGNLVKSGLPEDVFTSPDDLAGVKLKLPQVAELIYKLKHEDRLPFGRIPLTVGEARREILRLRYGYTTGACAAAAAKAAVMRLLGIACDSVEIPFPDGRRVAFKVCNSGLRTQDSGLVATASVIKDAGDDPDITHGAEIAAQARLSSPITPLGMSEGIVIKGGIGVGTVTRPGLPVPVGEPAINPVPKKMIYEAVMEAISSPEIPPDPPLVKGGRGDLVVIGQGEFPGLEITISVPEGERLARKTLNPRLGIIGGISILGTTGIVKPLSADAWTATIATSMDVAAAMGCEEIVLSAGRLSENAHKKKYNFPEPAYIMMGDYIGFSLQQAQRHNFKMVHLCAQWAKMLKIAMAAPCTHVRHGAIDMEKTVQFLKSFGIDIGFKFDLNTTRELFEIISSTVTTQNPDFFRRICQAALKYAKIIAPETRVTAYLVSFGGDIIAGSD